MSNPSTYCGTYGTSCISSPIQYLRATSEGFASLLRVYGEEQRLNGVREVGDHAVGDVEEFTAGADKSVLVYSFTYS